MGYLNLGSDPTTGHLTYDPETGHLSHGCAAYPSGNYPPNPYAAGSFCAYYYYWGYTPATVTVTGSGITMGVFDASCLGTGVCDGDMIPGGGPDAYCCVDYPNNIYTGAGFLPPWTLSLVSFTSISAVYRLLWTATPIWAYDDDFGAMYTTLANPDVGECNFSGNNGGVTLTLNCNPEGPTWVNTLVVEGFMIGSGCGKGQLGYENTTEAGIGVYNPYGAFVGCVSPTSYSVSIP